MNLYESDDELTNPDKYFENVWNKKLNEFNTYINKLPDDVEFINLNHYGMPEFPDLSRFHKLKVLSMSDNRVKKIPFLPVTLIEFTCNNNLLEIIPELPNDLLTLMCGNNKLKEIPKLPEKLEILCCEFNEIDELPEFNSKLRKIHCNNNKLKWLPKFNDELVLIICNNNQITTIPKLNAKLEEISCNFNLIQHFPTLHSTLKYVYCHNNPIQNLPKTNEKLIDLDFNCVKTPIGNKLNEMLVGVELINTINGFVEKNDIEEKTEICEVCKINQSMDLYELKKVNICYDCKDTLLDKSEFCDGCDSLCETKFTNCEMCQQNFCVNCMYLFCFECKEYYSCFWCGSKLKNENGIENIDNVSFRCSKHPIGLPKFKVEYRRHTIFEAEKEQNKYVDIKLLENAIITNTGDLIIHQVVENVSTNNNIEELDLDDTKHMKYIPEYKTEIENIVDLENDRKQYVMKSFVKQNGDWILLNEMPVEHTKIDIDFT